MPRYCATATYLVEEFGNADGDVVNEGMTEAFLLMQEVFDTTSVAIATDSPEELVTLEVRFDAASNDEASEQVKQLDPLLSGVLERRAIGTSVRLTDPAEVVEVASVQAS